MKKPLVGVVMGSSSDEKIMKKAALMLERLDIPYEFRVISAHRAPRLASQYASTAEERGLQVIVAGAGKAAHLAGVLASYTALPVIGVPLPTEDLGGMDSLLSTVQMPRGIPVASVAIGGAENAAILAAEILSLSRPEIRQKIKEFRKELAEAIEDSMNSVEEEREP
jgi:5-(carboxyamino)imidazole ribonucleotide mutase